MKITVGENGVERDATPEERAAVERLGLRADWVRIGRIKSVEFPFPDLARVTIEAEIGLPGCAPDPEPVLLFPGDDVEVFGIKMPRSNYATGGYPGPQPRSRILLPDNAENAAYSKYAETYWQQESTQDRDRLGAELDTPPDQV